MTQQSDENSKYMAGKNHLVIMSDDFEDKPWSQERKVLVYEIGEFI